MIRRTSCLCSHHHIQYKTNRSCISGIQFNNTLCFFPTFSRLDVSSFRNLTSIQYQISNRTYQTSDLAKNGKKYGYNDQQSVWTMVRPLSRAVAPGLQPLRLPRAQAQDSQISDGLNKTRGKSEGVKLQLYLHLD